MLPAAVLSQAKLARQASEPTEPSIARVVRHRLGNPSTPTPSVPFLPASFGARKRMGVSVKGAGKPFTPAALPSMETPQSDLGDLVDYICLCPLLPVAGMSEADVRSNSAEWIRLGEQLCKVLGFDFGNLDDVQRLRVFHYYLPVYMWMSEQLKKHKAATQGATAKPLVLGISAPQGCGKTTLVTCLEELMAFEGLRAASISIDDFYLTNADQTALADSNPSNPLLQYRGNAATHDMALGSDALSSLTSPSSSTTVPVPRYDKSKFEGRGDRADASTWPVVELPLDIVLFEGWMLGFRPRPDSDVEAVDSNLLPINEALRSYEEAWDKWVDSWLVIRVDDPQYVYKWRLQAEEQMRATGKAGMTDEQIADFVSRFMPAYKAYLPDLYSQGPTTCRPGSTLVIKVDERRSPVPEQPAPIS